MNVLVTGGAGFIASNLVDSLLYEGYRVTVVDNLTKGDSSHVSAKASFYQANILDNKLDRIFSDTCPEVVFHFAAQVDVQTSMNRPEHDAMSNIIGTINVLQCCIKYGVKKIIYASTAAVYGVPSFIPLSEEHPKNPISFYGASKYAPERYIELFSELHGLDYTILRYANAYGMRQDPSGEGGVVSIFLSKLLKGKPIVIFGDGEHTRDFVYVKDIVAANLAAISEGRNQIYNVSCNRQTSINQLLRLICKLTGRSFEPMYSPARKGEIIHSCLNNTKAVLELGWKPQYDLEHGLQETINYYRENLINT
ncbi:NAD-dependent epimerase/dehydratase family protein [Cohnella herbarum]|uniref:NAD-dependent epimerase/dehydratase family protein n=1 Tax=Cohnella herbarum TaxID=2728023 RepID=A0A7Z2ZMD4_9BACL|nr:NAD-dependent epimerase/dehydratase family protein [Cohnella herbarum]QJD85251.1 NAD-dependent epimerase/dehydratase family protein [Cohnella herbarum]